LTNQDARLILFHERDERRVRHAPLAAEIAGGRPEIAVEAGERGRRDRAAPRDF
jgi:hypothetical protein